MKDLLKSIKKNTILLLLITIIVLYVVLKDDLPKILEAFQSINLFYILIALFFYFLSVSIKGYVNYLITNDKDKISIREAIKHNLIAQFFNGVTPFSTGGQPMEIYMLTEHNIPVTKATNQTVQSFIFYQIALVICGVFAVAYNFFFPMFPKVRFLQHLVLLGFLINVGVAVFLIMISYSHKTMTTIANLTKKVLKKVKKEIKEEEIDNKFLEYYEGFQEMEKRKGLMTVGILLNIASLLCLYIVPLFVLYSMTNRYNLSVINTITASSYVYIVGAFVPIPGASGGIEYGFTQFFGNFIGIEMISAVLLIWRTITYYIGMIVGALLFNFEKKANK